MIFNKVWIIQNQLQEFDSIFEKELNEICKKNPKLIQKQGHFKIKTMDKSNEFEKLNESILDKQNKQEKQENQVQQCKQDNQDTLIFINPNCPKSLIMKGFISFQFFQGNVLFLMGRNEEAMEVYSRAIWIKEIQEKKLDQKKFPKGKFKYSLEEEQQQYRILSIPLFMKGYQIIMFQGRILQSKGNDLAEEYYKQAFKLEPNLGEFQFSEIIPSLHIFQH
ncbi:hypothetical protein pb186bvf_003391 [Paramecium bursaria]